MKKIFSILFALVLVLSFSLIPATPVAAADVNPGESIQAAVDGASWGDTIILDGIFVNYATVTVGTSGITIKSASPGSGILDGGVGPAFRLVDGLSDVTFEGLVIQNRTGGRGGGIEAWDMSTSNIDVLNNQFLDNTYNGILVGSEGGFVHSNWMVKGNTVDGNDFAGIELTNSKNSKIINNTVVNSGFAGIVVQARNTVADSGSVTINAVKVLRNTVDNASYGIYIFSFTGHPTNFTPITGASSLLTNVTVNNNTITDSGSVGVIFWSYNAAATARNATINHNSITGASSGPPSGIGVMVLEAGSGPAGTVKNVKVVNNTFTNCATDVIDYGQATKLPPGPM